MAKTNSKKSDSKPRVKSKKSSKTVAKKSRGAKTAPKKRKSPSRIRESMMRNLQCRVTPTFYARLKKVATAKKHKTVSSFIRVLVKKAVA